MARLRAVLQPSFLVWVLVAGIGVQAACGAQARKARGEDLAPFVPTPMHVVDKMLELAEVTSEDVVYDLGCGDGRIVVAAAEKHGARGVGVDFDAERVAEAKARAREHGVEDRVTILHQDAMTVDLADATVVTLYLLPSSNEKLKPRLTNLLPPGTRVVSHDFRMRGWKPLEEVALNEPGSYTHRVYLYRTPGGNTLSGTWTWPAGPEADAPNMELRLRESEGTIAGVLIGPAPGNRRSVSRAERRGDEVELHIESQDGQAREGLRFTGTLKDDRLVGHVSSPDGTERQEWKARRQAVHLDGAWSWDAGGDESTPLTRVLRLRRTADGVSGSLTVGDREFRIRRVAVEGSRVEFEASRPRSDRSGNVRYQGWVEGDTIVGLVRAEGSDAAPAPWLARRMRERGRS